MRISDWSSDVCSSDLFLCAQWHLAETETLFAECRVPGQAAVGVFLGVAPVEGEGRVGEDAVEAAQFAPFDMARVSQGRSEVRRVGKVCVRTGGSRWVPFHYTKQ